MAKITCEKCGKEVDKSNSREWKGERICNDCYDSKEVKKERKLKDLATGR